MAGAARCTTGGAAQLAPTISAAAWRVDGCSARRLPEVDRAGNDALEPPRLHGLLRQFVDRCGRARRTPHRGAQRQRDVVEDESRRDRAGAADARLAAADARTPREFFWRH